MANQLPTNRQSRPPERYTFKETDSFIECNKVLNKHITKIESLFGHVNNLQAAIRTLGKQVGSLKQEIETLKKGQA